MFFLSSLGLLMSEPGDAPDGIPGSTNVEDEVVSLTAVKEKVSAGKIREEVSCLRAAEAEQGNK